MKFVRTSLIMIAITLIALGVYLDEVSTVVVKSINICLECIGIG